MNTYLLGETTAEYERLRVQARVWEPATAALLDRTGIGPGARCLDVGCGPGQFVTEGRAGTIFIYPRSGAPYSARFEAALTADQHRRVGRIGNRPRG